MNSEDTRNIILFVVLSAFILLGWSYIFPPKTKKSVANLFSTHPPLEARIAALQRLEAQLQGTA